VERTSVYAPHVFLEAKIDFSDVRTGFSETCNVGRAATITLLESGPLWDDTAVRAVDPKRIGTSAPENADFADLPGCLDRRYVSWMETQFVQYLLRTFTVRVYRNFDLDVYSFSGESRNDFIIRCADLYKEPMYGEIDSVHKGFSRQLERLHQKYLGAEDSGEFEILKTASRNRELFHRISERVSGLFLRTEFSIQHVDMSSASASPANELEERLRDLYRQAREAVTRILDSCEEKAKSVDEYILHPAMGNIHFVSSCILWMPVEAE
jgi:hypothetical protein